MKNLQLKPVLLPTEDASELVIFPDGVLFLRKDKRNGTSQNQHLYLTSDAPIKEGDWYIGFGDKSVAPLVAKAKSGDVDIWKWHKERGKDLSHFVKIEFTTDPKLTQCDGKCAKNECVCDLVPAIDGKTKAISIYDVLLGDSNNTQTKTQMYVNFLEEFCSRYNQKDNKKVDVEKLAEEMTDSNGYAGDEAITYERGIVAGFEKCQALQSNAGGFSLEDMRNILERFVVELKLVRMFDDGEEEEYRGTTMEDINSFVRTLTKEQPKGELSFKKENIVIECDEETKTLIFK